MVSDFDLNVRAENYESDFLFDLNEIPSEEDESVNEYIPISIPGVISC